MSKGVQMPSGSIGVSFFRENSVGFLKTKIYLSNLISSCVFARPAKCKFSSLDHTPRSVQFSSFLCGLKHSHQGKDRQLSLSWKQENKTIQMIILQVYPESQHLENMVELQTKAGYIFLGVRGCTMELYPSFA